MVFSQIVNHQNLGATFFCFTKKQKKKGWCYQQPCQRATSSYARNQQLPLSQESFLNQPWKRYSSKKESLRYLIFVTHGTALGSVYPQQLHALCDLTHLGMIIRESIFKIFLGKEKKEMPSKEGKANWDKWTLNGMVVANSWKSFQ